MINDHVSHAYVTISLDRIWYTRIPRVHNSNFDFRSLTMIIVAQVRNSFEYNIRSDINKIFMDTNIAKKHFQRIGF